MHTKSRIEFQETAASATDFLHELHDPGLLRSGAVPPRVAAELRKQQVQRLRENIAVLVAKRDEFNRKMETYIENLRALIRSIEKSISAGTPAKDDETGLKATLVRCMGCDTERTFQELRIIFARESDDSLTRPTVLYVIEGAALKKGHFRCNSCGAENLVIRTV